MIKCRNKMSLVLLGIMEGIKMSQSLVGKWIIEREREREQDDRRQGENGEGLIEEVGI